VYNKVYGAVITTYITTVVVVYIKRSNHTGSISLGNLKQKCEQHSLTISLLEVRKSFIKL